MSVSLLFKTEPGIWCCLQSKAQLFTVYILFWQLCFSSAHQKDLMNEPTVEHLLVPIRVPLSLGAYRKISSKALAADPLPDRDTTDSADLINKQSQYVFKYFTLPTWMCRCLLSWMTGLPHSLLSFQLIPFFATKAKTSSWWQHFLILQTYNEYVH